MASFDKYAIFITAMLLAFHPWYATSDIFSPFDFEIEIQSVDKKTEYCGKGTCRNLENSTVGFVCECEDGWMQPTVPPYHADELKFLPCVVPNCTINSTCLKSEFTLPPKADKPSSPAYNMCNWIDCGVGTCNATSLYNYRCECEDGAFGDNCSKLGLKVPIASEDTSATTFRKQGGGIKWLIISAVYFLRGIVGLII